MLTVSVTLLPSSNVDVKSSSYILRASMTVTTPIIVHMLKKTQETKVYTCVQKKVWKPYETFYHNISIPYMQA